jgi:hypothetical protein
MATILGLGMESPLKMEHLAQTWWENVEHYNCLKDDE